MNRGGLLLVEDEPGDVLLLQRALSKAGINRPLQFVRDGEEAVAYLAGNGPFGDRARFPLPDVILLDLKIPRLSGLEVLAWIKAQPILRRIRVVVLTSSREAPDVNQAYELGISSYLVKPVEHHRLVEMVASLNSFLFNLSEGPDLCHAATAGG